MASPTFNSDVESFHRIVEQEFYSCETFENRTQFFAKAYSYQLFYNYFRPNSGKEGQSPCQIVQKAFPDINKNVLNLQPIHLDPLTTHFVEGGYHLPKFPINLTFPTVNIVSITCLKKRDYRKVKKSWFFEILFFVV